MQFGVGHICAASGTRSAHGRSRKIACLDRVKVKGSALPDRGWLGRICALLGQGRLNEEFAGEDVRLRDRGGSASGTNRSRPRFRASRWVNRSTHAGTGRRHLAQRPSRPHHPTLTDRLRPLTVRIDHLGGNNTCTAGTLPATAGNLETRPLVSDQITHSECGT